MEEIIKTAQKDHISSKKSKMSDRVIPIDHDDNESNGVQPFQGNSPAIHIGGREALAEYDHDGDGRISIRELEKYAQSHTQVKNDKKFLQKILLALFISLVFFTLAIAGLTMGIIEYSKDAAVDDKGSMRSKNDDTLVITGNPVYYALVTDIPLLPPAALNNLNRLNFVTSDGVLHNYLVSGVEVEIDIARVFFPRNKELYYEGDSVLFRTLDSSTERVISQLEVIVPEDANSRRLGMLMTEITDTGAASLLEDTTSLLSRCHKSAQVCFHTYDEIAVLGRLSDNQQRRLRSTSQQRRLVDYTDDGASVPTYAEIDADLQILKKDSFSSLENAVDFLESILGADSMNSTLQETTVIKFTMQERCVNYEDLAEKCMTMAAPSVAYADQEITESLRPFPGLVPIDSKWYFVDEIEYRRDPYSVCLKVLSVI